MGGGRRRKLLKLLIVKIFKNKMLKSVTGEASTTCWRSEMEGTGSWWG